MSGSLYLCGFMGCGKSHIGRMTAEKLERRYVDLDKYIVYKEKMTIPEIFRVYGERRFREMEKHYIKELSGGNVVATGGGALINDATAEYAKQSGIIIYINTAFEVCYPRIKNDKGRPLVVNNTEEELKKLYDYRAKIYRKNCTYMVNGNTLDRTIASEIVKLVRYRESKSEV